MHSIYIIQSKSSGRAYVGQTARHASRMREHKWKLGCGKHDNAHLQNAWNKYGPDEFEFFHLAEYDQKEECDEAEKFYIQWYRSLGAGFNHTGGGDGGCLNPDEVTREKLRNRVSARKGVEVSAETRAKMSAAKKGKPAPHLAANALKMCEKREFTEEYRQKLSEAAKGNTHWRGKHHTGEMKQAMSEARKGAGNPMFGRKWQMIDGKRTLI